MCKLWSPVAFISLKFLLFKKSRTKKKKTLNSALIDFVRKLQSAVMWKPADNLMFLKHCEKVPGGVKRSLTALMRSSLKIDI